MPEKGLTMRLYSPLTGDFYRNDTEEYGWNGGVADYPVLFTGTDLLYYKESIQEAVEAHNQQDGRDLMQFFDEARNPGLKGKALSAVPSVAVRNGELAGCTAIQLKEPLNEREMADLQSYLQGQFSDGWGKVLSSGKSRPAMGCCSSISVRTARCILRWSKPSGSLDP